MATRRVEVGRELADVHTLTGMSVDIIKLELSCIL